MKSKVLLIAALVIAASAIAYFSVAQKWAPVRCTKRVSRVGNGYVVCVDNRSQESISLWIKTGERQKWFNLPPSERKEFGWLEGFHFGANSYFSIGGDAYFASRYSVDSLGDCID